MLSFLSGPTARAVLVLGVAAAVLSACGERRPSADLRAKTASIARPVVAGFPRLSTPLPEIGPLDADEVGCRTELRRLGVGFRDLEPIREGACGIEHPVEVATLPGGVAMRPAAVLNCQMALAFSRWVRKELQPAARTRYLSSVASIRQGSAYSCRSMIGAGGGKLSEHARGNALDVMAIELANGREIDVRKPGFFSFRERGLLDTVRGDACDYFSTVLGPGYNKEHKDHFHFDLMPRRNGRVACR